MKKAHKVVTRDFPENIQGGIMICGINYGYSKQDEMADSDAVRIEQEQDAAPSFFSDVSVNGGPYKTRILEWLTGWGIPLERDTAQPSGLERSYLQTNWIDSQTRSIDSDIDEQINGAVLIERAEDGFLQLVEARRPRVIVFVGLMLIEAFNDIRLRSRVESLLGPRSGNASMHFGDDNLSKKRFKVLTQKFGDTWVVGLPHTSTQGLSYAYMQSIRLPDALLMELTQATRLADTEIVNRLVLEMVRDLGRQNPEELISRTQRTFKLGYNRAAQLVAMANNQD